MLPTLGAAAPFAAFTGFGGMSNVESDETSSSSIFGPHLIPILLGAIAGYYIERSFTAASLKKRGVQYSSSSYLGGKTGAIIGAIAGPVLFGLLLR